MQRRLIKMKMRHVSFVGFVIMICEAITKFSKNKGFKKLFKIVLGVASVFTSVCLAYGCILFFMETHKAEDVFEKYNRKKEVDKNV